MFRTIQLLLPAIIPSWRFFDAIAPSPRIEFILLNRADEPPQNWQEFCPCPMRVPVADMLKNLFWNPDRNESLFLVSCAERLLDHPTEHSLQEILKRIKADLPGKDHADFLQFRLLSISRKGESLQRHITFISEVYPL